MIQIIFTKDESLLKQIVPKQKAFDQGQFGICVQSHEKDFYSFHVDFHYLKCICSIG